MKLTEALKALQQADRSAPVFQVVLACGFTPLHLQTFLAAQLQQRLPARHVQITTGLYGDPAGTLSQARDVHAVALALEWSDLDPRLGYRGEGSWGRTALSGLPEAARLNLDRIGAAIEALPQDLPVAVSLPTLVPSPVFHTPAGRLSATELELQKLLLDFCSRIIKRSGCAISNPTGFGEQCGGTRFDLKSDLITGLPYTLPHADAVAAALAGLIAPAAPKKGLISDLDDTLWRGIVGEIGPDQVRWDLAGHSQVHGLYQQLLGALAEEGVLIAIASKNDPAVVERALVRQDLRIRPERLFPVEVSWNAKSAAVGRVLEAWNIGADSVVFVDDSPMELAEVAQAHPGIECLHFPKDDYGKAYALLRRLRDLFGKWRISEEDALRVESLRMRSAFQEAASGQTASEVFLAQAKAVLRVEWDQTEDERVLELVNKTNQFNLNGVRYSTVDWKRQSEQPGALSAAISYADQFGPLGKIAVIGGHQKTADLVYIDTWVMSCRAFSRRIEHQCLKLLFDRLNARCIQFNFRSTLKNGPMQEFFRSITGERPEGAITINRAQFEERCPPLYHEVQEVAQAWTRSNPA